MNADNKNSILIADDESSNIIALTHILSSDYKIYAAQNGRDAIEAALKYMPDVILLDILMPDMDGYEVITAMKNIEKTKSIPIVFITGLSSDDDEEKGLSLGAADYITKPFNSAIVKLRVLNQIKILSQLRTIERISMIDQLTNLPNRRSFELRLNSEWRRALREQKPLSILMIDVDRFKDYNDAYGHQQGDAALQIAAKVYSASIKRAGDFAARWGGEEFIVLLPNTDPRGAIGVAELIRSTIETTIIPDPNGKATKITVSVGVSTWMHGRSDTLDELISEADTSLYAAKNSGRNRVVHFSRNNLVKKDEKRKTVFIVDDNATNLTAAEDALEEEYRVVALSSAAQMFTILKRLTPDMILLDIEMPDMDGFEAMERLKASSAYTHIPVIFLTGLIDAESEAHGIELGAVDFIAKPFSKPVLLNRIRNHLHIDNLIRKRTTQLVMRTEQLIRLQNSIVYTLSDIVESRDENTGGHIDRTVTFMEILISAMLERGVYADDMRNWNLDSVISSARLHDIGKIAIPDAILNKPGPLTTEEAKIMKSHTVEGERILDKAMQRADDTEFLHNAKLFAAYHHERWDGSGYSYGMKGMEIPLHGRIMAVVDVYDALVSERPYKKTFTHEQAVSIITEESGRHFDPKVAEVFAAVSEQIRS